MEYLLGYLIIGCLYALYGYIKKFKDYDTLSVCLMVFLWPLVTLATLLPDDLD